MIKCSNCGAEMTDNQKFCSECGTPVSQTKVIAVCFFEDETVIYEYKNTKLNHLKSIRDALEYDVRGILKQESLECVFQKLEKIFNDMGCSPQEAVISVRHKTISEQKQIRAEFSKLGINLKRVLNNNACIQMWRYCKELNNNNEVIYTEKIVGLCDNCFCYECVVCEDGVMEVVYNPELPYDAPSQSSCESIESFGEKYKNQESDKFVEIKRCVVYGHPDKVGKYYNTLRFQLGMEIEILENYKSYIVQGLNEQLNNLYANKMDVLLLDINTSSIGMKTTDNTFEEMIPPFVSIPTKKSQSFEKAVTIVEKFRDELLELDHLAVPEELSELTLDIDANDGLNITIKKL